MLLILLKEGDGSTAFFGELQILFRERAEELNQRRANALDRR